MLGDITSSLNIIDILIGCIVLRCIYIAVVNGIVVETFKLVGMFFATFISLHYFVQVGAFLHNTILMPAPIQEQGAFLLLWLTVVLVFKVIRDGWMVMAKSETHPIINKGLSAFLGIVRSALTGGMIFVYLLMSGNSYLINNAKKAYTGRYLTHLSPRLYGFCFNFAVAKLFVHEKKNDKVFKLGKPSKEDKEAKAKE